MYQVVNNLSHQRGAHALRAGVDVLYNDDTITFPRAFRGALHVLVARQLPRRHLQQRRVHADLRRRRCRRRNPNVGLYAQDEWKRRAGADAQPGPALRPAVPRDDRHRHQQRLAARRLRLDAVASRQHGGARRRRPLLRPRAAARGGQRAALGRQHHRPRRPAADQRQPVAGAGRRAGVSRHPRGAGAVGHAGQPHDHGPRHRRTRTRARPASKWNSSSARGSTVSVGYQYVRGRDLMMSINQNVPSCVAAGTNNGCRPNPAYANNSRYSSAGDVDLSWPARVVRAAAVGLGLLPRQLHAVEGDERRRRVLLQLADRSVRPVEGLGPLRRRSAASAGAVRHRQHVAGAGAAAWEADPRVPAERHAAGLLGAAVQHHVRA